MCLVRRGPFRGEPWSKRVRSAAFALFLFPGKSSAPRGTFGWVSFRLSSLLFSTFRLAKVLRQEGLSLVSFRPPRTWRTSQGIGSLCTRHLRLNTTHWPESLLCGGLKQGLVQQKRPRWDGRVGRGDGMVKDKGSACAGAGRACPGPTKSSRRRRKADEELKKATEGRAVPRPTRSSTLKDSLP